MNKSLYGHVYSFLLAEYLNNGISKSHVSIYLAAKPLFQDGCTILHALQQCMRVPVAQHPCQNWVWSVFLILAILIDV